MHLLSDVPTLHGSRVRLEPLASRHAPDLALAAAEGRDAYDFTLVPDGAAGVDAYLAAQFERVAAGRMAPFAQVRTADGRAVGCTAYWDPRTWPGRPQLCAIDVGFTWLSASAQGTGINLEAKLLLFRHAFEHLGVVRVDLTTDARNERCRRALAGTGARLEGVLRSVSPGADSVPACPPAQRRKPRRYRAGL